MHGGEAWPRLVADICAAEPPIVVAGGIFIRAADDARSMRATAGYLGIFAVYERCRMA